MTAFPTEITTASGKKLSLKEIDPGDMLDLIEAAGSAMNGASAAAWMGYAQMVCSVVAVDGVPVQFPESKDDVKALARQIGSDGIVALQKTLYPETDTGIATAADAERETAKN